MGMATVDEDDVDTTYHEPRRIQQDKQFEGNRKARREREREEARRAKRDRRNKDV